MIVYSTIIVSIWIVLVLVNVGIGIDIVWYDNMFGLIILMQLMLIILAGLIL